MNSTLRVDAPDGREHRLQWKGSPYPCLYCGSRLARFAIWPSRTGEFEDIVYRCDDCSTAIWFDGSET